jgi:hypothetical protein
VEVINNLKVRMDINTPKGRQTLADEAKAASLFSTVYPHFTYCETPKDEPANVDAVLVKDKEIFAVVETKCRYDMTFVQLIVDREAQYLISFDKILKGKVVSHHLGVPFLIFVYLVAQDILIVTKITDSSGEIVCKMQVTERLTQRTVNGGTIRKTVALIDLENAKVLRRTKT